MVDGSMSKSPDAVWTIDVDGVSVSKVAYIKLTASSRRRRRIVLSSEEKV